MNRQTNSLSNKLIKANRWIVGLAMLVFGLIVYLGLWSLTKSFSEFNSVNTQKTKETIRKQAEENIQHIRKNFETALLKRARVTLEKDAIFIQRMMEENSFNSLRDFIVQFAKNDSSVVYGAFWVVENNTLGAWQVVNLQVPSGLDMPITWDAEKKGWQGLLKGEPQFVPDLDVEAYNDLTEPKVRIVSKSQSDGNSDSSQYVDAVIPIASGMSVSSVKATRASGSAIGYLKYQFSMREMEEQIQKEQTVLEASLKDIETANQKAAEKLNDLAIEKSLFLTGILFLVGVGIVIVVTIISRHFSLRVTKPIEQLTNVAAEMVRGKYEQAIAIESDDEIGLFADTFQELSSAIVQRDNELASINKDLEHKVEERTEQLSKELNTTANLLNNMKQAVFSVDSNGLIIPPVSRSAYTIFGGAIEGQSVMEVVYRDLERESSQMDPLKSALVTIFGEDELQWDLMESNLPRRVIRHGSIDKEDVQKLRISYSPLWNREMKLEHLMFVVEDVSHVEKLESEIVELRQQSEERAQIIQEVSDADPASVKGFMSSAAFALAEDLTKRPITLPRLTAIRKNLHTIKGNARACGFSLNAKMVHGFEDRCQAIADRARQSGILLETEAQEIDEILKKLHEQISEYSVVAAQIFKIKTEFKGQSSEWLSLNQNLRSFERMILDSAKSSGKTIQYLVVGEEISLESTQVQVLRDSFIHLLNNCLAHGIESPEERIKKGKNSVGNITIEIRRERQNIVMVLTDDGSGIDLEKLGRVVIEKGLKSEKELSSMSRQDQLELVFLPNVSSLEGVNQIAGRGLGLDVVKENVQMLGGSIKVMSEVGSGTAFEITVPSVLSGREAMSA